VFYGRFVLGEGFPKVLRAAADGDGAAFAALWRDSHPPLLRYLWVAAGDAAEDLASDVWLDVARRIAKFKGGEPEFRGWLFTMARRRVIDRHRYEARHPESPTGDMEPLDRPASDDTFAAAFEDISTSAALALIATLPRDQAEIIVLRVVVGMDATEVAALVGKSPGAVRVAAHRGLRSLNARLAGARTVPPGQRDTAADRGGVTL
jgi:RNA polymerase sigma-70 factor, ECF subfamily